MDKSMPDEASFVLIAEDDEAVRDLTATVLEDAGWDVRRASNGRDAVALFRNNCHRVAAVLLDLMMPEMDGQHALQEIRRQCRDVPVIVISGLDGRSVLQDSLAKTVFAFVQKPFRITDLVAIVHRAAEMRRSPGPACASGDEGHGAARHADCAEAESAGNAPCIEAPSPSCHGGLS